MAFDKIVLILAVYVITLVFVSIWLLDGDPSLKDTLVHNLMKDCG